MLAKTSKLGLYDLILTPFGCQNLVKITELQKKVGSRSRKRRFVFFLARKKGGQGGGELFTCGLFFGKKGDGREIRSVGFLIKGAYGGWGRIHGRARVQLIQNTGIEGGNRKLGGQKRVGRVGVSKGKAFGKQRAVLLTLSLVGDDFLRFGLICVR